jgi:Tol biopolymer transport system component/DNA-binding winged helix-turn-helix (wHTH) protein
LLEARKSLKEKHLYRFGIFNLCADENVLRRESEVVPLTPKMFDLLLVLVKNSGRVLEKDFLLKAVWPDSFVEEGNISFNIRQLRKALGDDAQAPTYIETVPRRGYRFVADVKEVLPEPESENGDNPADVEAVQTKAQQLKKYVVPSVAVSVLLVGAIVIGSWFIRSNNFDSAPVLSAPFASEKLSTTGTVYGAAISPDGKTVVYSNRNAGKQSVWLRQLESNNNIEIIPPSEEDYYEFTFAPDGNSIYFSRAIRGIENHIDIYRVSIFGGIPEKIVDGTEGSISVSPDGNKLSFVRCLRRDDEWCSLWLSDLNDGKKERKLTSRPRPIRIADIEISPDGKSVAFAVGQSRNAANEFNLAKFDLETGTEQPITSEKFFNIKNLLWLPDQSGLLLTASRIPNKYFRIWHVSASSGAAEPLTKDSEAYSILSLDNLANSLVSTQIKQDFRLYVFDIENKSEKRFLTDAARAAFAPDGRIYFASTMSGNDEIWSINLDGSGQRQLTNDPAGDGSPIVSPEGKSVFFASNRSGEAHVWRMSSDGSNQTQITRKGGGVPVFASSDGTSLYYRHAINGTLWLVSLENGEESLFLDQSKPFFAFSPDGSMVAFEERKGEKPSLTIISPHDSRAIKSFELPKEKSRLLEFAWLPNGKSIMYLMSDVEYKKTALYEQPFNGEPVRKIVDLDDEQLSETLSLTISPDGKSFALVQGGWKHDAVLLRGLK